MRSTRSARRSARWASRRAASRRLGGGCSGLSYQFKFDTKPRSRDKVYDFDGVQIYVDPKSILYLHGMTLDYKESLMQSGFVFEIPNAEKELRLRHVVRGLTCFAKCLFEIFELRAALSLDAADLDKRFLALSRKYHPDLFSRRPPPTSRKRWIARRSSTTPTGH